jgi:parallel beta-helix repeat protein
MAENSSQESEGVNQSGAIGGNRPEAMCGDIITEDTELDRDLDCRGTRITPALIVEGPATLDLNGHVLICSEIDVGGSVGDGVSLTAAQARLVDGTVTGCGLAVGLLEDGRHTVRDVTFTGSGDGIEVGSSGNLIERNLLNVTADAIRVLASNNRVIGNHIDGGNAGVLLTSTAVIAADSTAVIDNVVTGSDVGIPVTTNENAIRANQLSGNGTGILVVSSAQSNALTGNNATGNTTDLIDQNAGCDDNDWHGNTFDTANQDCID